MDTVNDCDTCKHKSLSTYIEPCATCMVYCHWQKTSTDPVATQLTAKLYDVNVVKPSHYTRWEIEPITFTMLNNFEGWRANIVKYASRAGFKLYPDKTEVESEIIDLQKAIRYSEMRINMLNGKDQL